MEVLRSNYYIYFENVWTKFHHLRSTTLKDCDSAKEAINQAHAFALEHLVPAAYSFGMVAATSSAAIERVVHAALFPAVVRPEEFNSPENRAFSDNIAGRPLCFGDNASLAAENAVHKH